MRTMLLSVVAVIAISSAPALAQSDEVCPSGQINTSPADAPVKCETDVTATTPAPDIVEDAGRSPRMRARWSRMPERR